MGAVANVTEYSNAVVMANVIAAKASPAFVKSGVGMESLYRENLPVGSNVKSFPKRGSLTAASLAESTALAVGANGELTDTKVDATSAKCAVVSGLSLEAQTFTELDTQRMADEAGAAIGRYVSNDIIGNAANLSSSVTATSTLTLDDLYLAQLTIFAANCPNQEVLLHFLGAPKAFYALKKEIAQTGASAWVNPNMIEILTGLPGNAGFMGVVPGLAQCYQTTGFATTGGDDQQMLIHPMWCLAGIFAASPDVWITNKGSEGFYTEVASAYQFDTIEWNDAAGVMIRSDT